VPEMLRFGRRRERENAKCIDNVCRRLCLNATYVYCRLLMNLRTSLMRMRRNPALLPSFRKSLTQIGRRFLTAIYESLY